MLNIKNYKIGFDVGGLVLFFIVMLPNIVWFLMPATNDVFRSESLTPLIDGIASVFQMIMIIGLCVIVNQCHQKPMEKMFLTRIIILITLYYIGWFLYYAGFVNATIILILCITPCLAFILFSISRQNIVVLVSASLFMVCHVLSTLLLFGLVRI